jgi:hypothetical protein
MSRLAAEVEALAEGLGRRLRDVMLAERRLETFAFSPEQPAAERPARLARLLEDEGALASVARDLTLRALGVAGDGVNYRLLSRIAGQAVELDDLAVALGLPPLAVSERAGALAQAGLAARDVERDAVAATAAGRAVVALVERLAAGLVARCRAEGGLSGHDQ